MEPDRVNEKTILICDTQLKENLLKRLIRRIVILYISFRYDIKPIGKGFQWGRWIKWNVKRGMIKAGHYSYLGNGADILYPTIIGDLCMIARDVRFIGNDHGYDQVGVPIRLAKPQIDAKNSITIVESEAWIGQGSTIFTGIRIGRGSIVAAGSVVTKDVPPYSIVAGVPAKVIKKRFASTIEEEKHKALLYG